MRFLLLTLTLCALAIPSAPPASAQTLGLNVNGGTRGVGAGVTGRIADGVNGRLNIRFFPYALDGEEDLRGNLVGYEADLNLFSVAALVDWHPFDNAFRVTGGAIFNASGADGSFQPIEPVTVGSRTYQPADLGSVSADVEHGSPVAPYVGIGFGNALTQRIGFSAEIGSYFPGSPNVDLTATDILEPTGDEEQERTIEDNIDWAFFYPVISLGVSFRLF